VRKRRYRLGVPILASTSESCSAQAANDGPKSSLFCEPVLRRIADCFTDRVWGTVEGCDRDRSVNVDAGIKRQHFRRFCSQRKSGHQPGGSTHSIRDSKFYLAGTGCQRYHRRAPTAPAPADGVIAGRRVPHADRDKLVAPRQRLSGSRWLTRPIVARPRSWRPQPCRQPSPRCRIDPPGHETLPILHISWSR
jgi:hypothetical protein